MGRLQRPGKNSRNLSKQPSTDMKKSAKRASCWRKSRVRAALPSAPAPEALIIAVIARRPHPEQGFRTCVGSLRLFRGLEASRVEAASIRAVEIGALSDASVGSILKHRLNRTASSAGPGDGAPLLHDDIRGSGYYHWETDLADTSHARPARRPRPAWHGQRLPRPGGQSGGRGPWPC